MTRITSLRLAVKIAASVFFVVLIGAIAILLSSSVLSQARQAAGPESQGKLLPVARSLSPAPEAPASAPATAVAKSHLGKLAFVKDGDIWVKELPDAGAIRLTQDGRNDTPMWSASGKWLAFRKRPSSPDMYGLCIIHADGSDAHCIDSVRSGIMNQYVAWSPAEDRLAYVARWGQLRVIKADETNPRELVASLSRDGGGGISSIAWSPNGQWLAFDKWELEKGRVPTIPTAQGLWRIKPDGSQMEAIYLNPDPLQNQSYLAGWSPDGHFVLFWQGKQNSASFLAGGVPLMRVPVTGGIPSEVAPAVLYHRDMLSWSPDGQRLALVVGANRETWYNKRMAVTQLESGLSYLNDETKAGLFPAWSPDGSRIAFSEGPAAANIPGGDDAKNAMARRHIWLASNDGTDPQQLTDDAEFRDERPRFSADGSFILFARLRDDQRQLWLMRSDGSEQQLVADGLGAVPSSREAPAWFGFYGYTDWERLYDWWSGKAAAEPSPTPDPTAVSTTVATPSAPPSTAGLDAFLQSAVGALKEPIARHLSGAAMASEFVDLARKNGVEIRYIKRSDGDPEAWVGWSRFPSGDGFML